ncbi:hypothetical protein FACS1894204_11830 [Synergistales bacterium]|nr:hypothetical protein FACS1894204_11830 [Synergistales bacterium]
MKKWGNSKETAIDKYDRSVSGKNHIGNSWVTAVVLAVAESAREQIPPDERFRLCITSLNARHIIAPHFF